MLTHLKNNFDPMIFFHIESCMQAEEKILIHSHYDETLNSFAHAKITSTNEIEDNLRKLLKAYFKKRETLSEKSFFIYS
jgi:hypothetical protein